jgi:hypothetical protein
MVQALTKSGFGPRFDAADRGAGAGFRFSARASGLCVRCAAAEPAGAPRELSRSGFDHRFGLLIRPPRHTTHPMPKLSPGDLRALLAAEKADALSAMSASKLSSERSRALDYYLGDMTRDMPAPEGRSKAVSTDVADTIEGLMPTLMDIFCGGDEVVRFEPVGPEDVAAAEQETDYVNHVFMQRNPGFLVLYSFIKDALLSKVGIVKVWWETREEFERETYLDLTEEQFAIIAGDPAVEIVEHTEKRIANSGEERIANSEIANSKEASDYSLLATRYSLLHDVTVETRRSYQSARVEAVPPEEFGIARNARSIRDAGYVFHDVLRRQEELIAQGYDAEQVKALPSWSALANVETQARDTVEERSGGPGEEGTNKANRLIRITEHYVRMDYEGDGKPCLYRVTTGSGEGDILTRDGEPDIVRADQIPFAAMTPVIITHRFFGRSVADLVMDIQRIKTALLRALLDNAYLANNPRTEVPESHATETTLDDLLVSRPGGIVRTKMPGGLSVIQHPDIGGHVFPLLQYQDTTREWRTGVSRQGQGVDPNALQNQVATIANQMFNAAQAKVKLIARIFAETGIRDLFTLLHATIRKHGGEPATVRLRNRWVTIDPRDWKERNDMTVNVGLGTGGKSEQLAHLNMIIAAQKEAIAAGMVSPKNLYNSAKELTRLAGHKNVDTFFTPPGAPPDPNDPTSSPITPPASPEIDQMNRHAEIEKLQAQADIATQNRKVEAEIVLAERKFELERELKLLDASIKRDQHEQVMQTAMARALMTGGEPGPDGEPAEHPLLATVREFMAELKKANAPRRVVRDAQGMRLEPMQ